MITLQSSDRHIIHEIAQKHAALLHDDPTTAMKSSRLTVKLYEEMMIHRLKYATDLIQVKLDENHQMIAYIWGHFDSPMQQVIIESLYVHPEHRQKGIAYQLKRKIESWAQSLCAKQIMSTVRVDNEEMRQLNQKLGYTAQKVIMTKIIED
ncbi:GNAT family N-acetyltransferase [Staphylococcus felis]|uniref:GNAT family N-acetyltransferase n=1 Tax=Staphylococcus felis TaxID=46127 RepID=A0ABS0QP33_9STAP|nr:GNAT family N-acetyltransferase [Staphylococcus felis]MBH9580791.1 GNAT family N-acetyltransferase [Staphylococcus felis]REH75291.1 GNAT family N-acetyltransferase [Staphylococcus felis]REH76334.1 GNAT family N-acetyltransferase [Staphylococcus felis]REH98093.1 GNAT family N-acetyltransferase [Staphylococcus felis]REI03241.1 GNAT family N-acetyltransferase [Staphylococcus felis]